MVDCSHANSNKQPELQPLVVENVVNQILEGNASIVGLMIESHLNAGSQPLAPPSEPAPVPSAIASAIAGASALVLASAGAARHRR